MYGLIFKDKAMYVRITKHDAWYLVRTSNLSARGMVGEVDVVYDNVADADAAYKMMR